VLWQHWASYVTVINIILFSAILLFYNLTSKMIGTRSSSVSISVDKIVT